MLWWAGGERGRLAACGCGRANGQLRTYMARKRAADFVNLESGEESDDAELNLKTSLILRHLVNLKYSYGYDESNESIKRAAYVQVLKDVMYLDFVNFGGRQVPDDIPRIAVWKGEMLKEYSSFDMKSTGSYGCHPLLDFSATCYSKDMIFLQNRSSILLDDDFCEKLDSYSGCKLPVVLKEKICNLIQTFCFNPRVPVNLDVNSINGLPDEMKKSFCNLLNYVSNINSRTPKLILDLVKLFADSADTDDPNIVRSPQVTPSHEPIRTPVNNNFDFSEPKDFDNIEENGSHGVFCSQYELHKSFHSSSHLNIDPQGNCEVQIVGEKTLSDKVQELSNKYNALYNSNLRNSGASAATPVVVSPHGPSASRPCTQSVSFRARDNSTGGKMPRYGPRRLLNPGPLFQGDFCTTSNKISVSKSQIDNCKAICKLSSSQFKGLENLLKDPEFADEDVLSRAFRRSSKARALHLSNMRSAFEFYWQKYIHFDMGFDEYDFIFPVVPQQPLDNTFIE
nr:unnamed protein product [Digitaria exilis]